MRFGWGDPCNARQWWRRRRPAVGRHACRQDSRGGRRDRGDGSRPWRGSAGPGIEDFGIGRHDRSIRSEQCVARHRNYPSDRANRAIRRSSYIAGARDGVILGRALPWGCGMRRLSVTTKDLRRLLDVTDPAQGDEPGGPLPWSLLSGLMDLVGCDAVTYESHDIGNSAVRHHQATSSDPAGDTFETEAVRSSFWDLYWGGLCDYWPRTGDYTSVRRMLAEPDWSTTPYGEWIRGLGVRGEITVAFPPDGQLHHRLLLWRFSGRDFTERDCLLLTLLQPRIAMLQARVPKSEAGVDLTPRQWELIRLIAAGRTNRQIASQLLLSEGTVRTHCEHIFQRLQVTNRVAAVAKAFPRETMPG